MPSTQRDCHAPGPKNSSICFGSRRSIHQSVPSAFACMCASIGSRRFFAKSFRYGSSICQARCTSPSNQYVPPSLLHEPFSSLPQLRLTPRGFQSADHARRKWWLTSSMCPV